jgi:hypothetical protein
MITRWISDVPSKMVKPVEVPAVSAGTMRRWPAARQDELSTDRILCQQVKDCPLCLVPEGAKNLNPVRSKSLAFRLTTVRPPRRRRGPARHCHRPASTRVRSLADRVGHVLGDDERQRVSPSPAGPGQPGHELMGAAAGVGRGPAPAGATGLAAGPALASPPRCGRRRCWTSSRLFMLSTYRVGSIERPQMDAKGSSPVKVPAACSRQARPVARRRWVVVRS